MPPGPQKPAIDSRVCSIRHLIPLTAIVTVAICITFSTVLLNQCQEDIDELADTSNTYLQQATVETDAALLKTIAISFKSVTVSLHATVSTVLHRVTFDQWRYIRFLLYNPEWMLQPKITVEWMQETRFNLHSAIRGDDFMVWTVLNVEEEHSMGYLLRDGKYYYTNGTSNTHTNVSEVGTPSLLPEGPAETLPLLAKATPITDICMRGDILPPGLQWVFLKTHEMESGPVLVGNFQDPVTQRRIVTQLHTRGQAIHDLLRELVVKIQRGADVDLGTRSFAVLGSDFSDKFDDLTEQLFWRTTGSVVAASHGPVRERVSEYRYTYYRDVAHPDVYVSGASTALKAKYGGYAEAARMSNDSALMIDIPQRGTFFAHVEHKTDDAFPDLFVVLIMDAKHVYGDFKEKAEEARQAQAVVLEGMKGDLSDQELEARLVMVAITIVIVVIISVVSAVATKPLRVLQQDMQRMALLKLCPVDGDQSGEKRKASVISEIKSMQVSFERMKADLALFKTYVPNAVLHNSSEELTAGVTPPAGRASLVFTDIKNSTTLWERDPTAMDSALEAHNDIMRKALKTQSGYEVKTIGDSFMVAFADAENALAFCFKAQVDLLAKAWPDSLLLHTYSGKQGKQIHGGLQVRMGAHCGLVTLEENPITGRADYRGNTVNIAARVEAKARPGTICVTESFFGEVCGLLSGKDGNTAGVYKRIGEHELKGLQGKHDLFWLAPRALAERLEDYALDLVDQHSGGNLRSHSASLKPAPGKQGKCSLYLKEDEGTVAVCKVSDTSESRMFDAQSQIVRSASDGATQTEGTLLALCGNVLVVSWNTSKPCRQHVKASIAFAARMHKTCNKAARVGIATGNLLYGNVGSTSTRFSNVTSDAIYTATLAADVSGGFHTMCLFACAPATLQEVDLRGLLRLVDIWGHPHKEFTILVHEVLTGKLEEEESLFHCTACSILDAHETRFRAALTGNTAALGDMHIMGADDKTLKRVADNLESMPSPNAEYRVAVDLGCSFLAFFQGKVGSEPAGSPLT
ncbi:Adenylate cyclase [Diplonema papillatum]|nr:Adenylate cyclase [Diplonema papillatum]